MAAQYINLIALLSRSHRVYVLDPRNQGLSQRVGHGGRIARFSMDLEEFGEHLGIASADYVRHSYKHSNGIACRAFDVAIHTTRVRS